MSFITAIDKIKNHSGVNGLFGKMDKVLQLAKQGYKAAQIKQGLKMVVEQYPPNPLSTTALEVYSRRVR